MRQAKPLILWLYFNVLANAFPYVVLLNDDFDSANDVIERLIFCTLFTVPSVYAIVVVFSYYRELSQSRGLVLTNPRLAGSEFWYYPGAPISGNRSVEIYLASHYPPSTQQSKYDFVWVHSVRSWTLWGSAHTYLCHCSLKRCFEWEIFFKLDQL